MVSTWLYEIEQYPERVQFTIYSSSLKEGIRLLSKQQVHDGIIKEKVKCASRLGCDQSILENYIFLADHVRRARCKLQILSYNMLLTTWESIEML